MNFWICVCVCVYVRVCGCLTSPIIGRRPVGDTHKYKDTNTKIILF